MEFKSAKCPSCQGELMVPDNKDFVICMYCGTSVKVREAIIVYSEKNTANWFTLAEDAYYTRNYDEAYDFYNKILENNPQSQKALIGKGKSAGYLFDDGNSRLNETIYYFEKAIEFSESKEALKKNLASVTTTIAVDVFKNSLDNFMRRVHEDKIVTNHLGISYEVITALEWSYNIMPDPNTLKWIIYICDKILVFDINNSIYFKYLVSAKTSLKNWQEYKDWTDSVREYYEDIIKAEGPQGKITLYNNGKIKNKYLAAAIIIIFLLVLYFLSLVN